MLNKSGPNIEPWGIPEVISSQLRYDDPILVLCFPLEDNPVSFLKQDEADRKHSILLQVNHGIYNQMLLIDQ